MAPGPVGGPSPPARVVGGHVLYSHVVVVEGKKTIFVSGQLARGPGGEVVGKGDMGAQLRQVGENIKAALAAAGATLADIVKTNTYVTDIDEFFTLAERMPNVDGIIVTVPHKFDAARLCTHVTPRARSIGAPASIKAKSGIVAGSASAGSPGQNHRPPCACTTGRLAIRAEGGRSPPKGLWTQAPLPSKVSP